MTKCFAQLPTHEMFKHVNEDVNQCLNRKENEGFLTSFSMVHYLLCQRKTDYLTTLPKALIFSALFICYDLTQFLLVPRLRNNLKICIRK